jgi:hypothetical protein
MVHLLTDKATFGKKLTTNPSDRGVQEVQPSNPDSFHAVMSVPYVPYVANLAHTRPSSINAGALDSKHIAIDVKNRTTGQPYLGHASSGAHA